MKKNNNFLSRLIKAVLALGTIFAALYGFASYVRGKDKKDEDLKKDAYPVTKSKWGITPSVYETYIKRFIDLVLSFFGLIILAPVFAFISLAIFVDDPGPVLFTQKRVGKNKAFFKLHKFRSMKMCTPHDTPTHLLENPEQYITKVGKILRKYSLDELPQIWDIFVGNLSIVGPRPALWNQADLVAERDKYGANDVYPGLTGWAQVNGRDELEIPVKAKLDGEYCAKLRSGSMSGFVMDLRCFVRTISSVLGAEGVVEGGTGEMSRRDLAKNNTEEKFEEISSEELIGNIGFKGIATPDFSKKVRVLVTGKGSYIGESFINYAKKEYGDNFEADTLDMLSDSWREADFSSYDIVYHVAGLAHADVGNVSDEVKEKYYRVNRDLAVEVAEKAKKEGVRKFIFMSSMIVYGDSAPYGKTKIITENTVPKAANFYGDSKLQADLAVRKLADDSFKVIVLRPPMIYGRGSKGNYPMLAKLAGILPVFPKVVNTRSMLYIDNLCEFLCKIMLTEPDYNATVLIPQNPAWTNTSEMVKDIAQAKGKKIYLVSFLAPFVFILSKIPGKIGGLVNKAFGNFTYSHSITKYEGIGYQKVSLKESIIKTEGDCKAAKEDLKTENSEAVVSSADPLVSLVTVAYNSEATIRKTIESVLNQTYTKLEYRIVDGASSDNTVAIAREYEEAFWEKGILYIITSEPDRGIYDAMNKGIADATGEIIGIINSDDWFEKDAVETVVKTYKETGFDYFYADINLVREDGSVIVKHSREDKIVTSRHWNHPTSFVARKVYEELGTFKCEGIHDDFEFFLRVRKAGKKMVIVNKVLANFKTGGVSNDKTFEKCRKRCMDRYRCYRSNGYSPLYVIECVAIELAKYILS